MNRIVLIGNGFDLAHGLPTSYQQFVRWYCDQRINAFVGNITDTSSDLLCSFQDLRGQVWNVNAFNNGLLWLNENVGFLPERALLIIIR